ncbi:MAG: redoxin domain-containing protein [Bacteroidota bacterium]
MRSLVVVLMVVCVLAGCKNEKPKEVVLNATQTAPVLANAMPQLTVTQTDGTTISMKELTGKVLLVCYNPDCDHCQREAKRISDTKDMIKDYQVYFLTPSVKNQSSEVENFAKEYKLIEPNIHFVTADVTPIIAAIGSINTVPTFFVFRDQVLIKRLEGEIPMEQLRAVLQ